MYYFNNLQIQSLTKLENLTFKISNRQLRTLIFISITPRKNPNSSKVPLKRYKSFRYEEYNDQYVQNINEGGQNFVHNRHQVQESRKKLQNIQKQLEMGQIYNFDEREEDQAQGQVGCSQFREKVVFVVIFHHQLYPYQAPYVAVSLKDHFPRVDDFRNYFYDIMQIDRWWPFITLEQIITRMPHFAYRLIQSTKFQSNIYYGQFEYDNPIYREDLYQICPNFYIQNLPIRTTAKMFFLPYQKKQVFRNVRLIYFTYCQIILLSEESKDVFKIEQIYSIEQITHIQLIEKRDHYRIKVIGKQGILKMKLHPGELQKSHLQGILLKILYFKSVIRRPAQKGRDNRQLIDIYNQIIISAYELKWFYIVEWAKNKIISISDTLIIE